MKTYAETKSRKLEEGLDSLFTFAEKDSAGEEQTGYSCHSYWGSTLRAFCRNKFAMTMAVILVLILAFTVIQPLLPGQRDANTVNNYPVTGLQISNMSPTADNCIVKAPAGTELMYKEVEGYPDWYAVTGYGDDLYTNPDTSSGGWLYVEKTEVELTGSGTVTAISEAKLRAIPSVYGFLFGTNSIGQDLWARVWSGTRTSLSIGFIVAMAEVCLGTFVGLLWGYARTLNGIVTELYNVLSNIPNVIVIILITYIMRPSVGTLIFSICLTSWLGTALFIRNQIMIIRDRDYNVVSRCLGATAGQIMLKNLLPYMVSVIMLRMVLAIPAAIGNEVFISYIGLGVPVDTPSLGNLINEGRKLLTGAAALKYQLLFPMAVLTIIAIAFYSIGNAFADAADPRNHL